MKKIILLIGFFYLGAFLLIQRKAHPELDDAWGELKSGEREEGEEDERFDQPNKLQEYLNAIKIREGETKSGYGPSYQFLEHQKAQSQAARKKPSAFARTQSNNGVLEWKERGPGNVPGRTRGLLVDPDDTAHKTWYAGSAGGGIWKTTDGGNSWTWLTSTLPNLATTSLAMAESNHNVMYAGTGEGFGNIDGVTGHGLFKSSDRGQHWSLLNATINFGDINRLIINPATENTLVVVSNLGIYRTIDGGLNWAQVFTGIVQDIDATPGNFNIQYAGQFRVGVLKSIDGGQNWQLSNTGMSPAGRVEIAVSPVNPNRVFASTQGSLAGNNSDLFMSDDAGNTWSLMGLTLSGKTVDFLSGGGNAQGWYDNTIVCDPFRQDIVYVGGVGIYQVQVGTGFSLVDTWTLDESTTKSFLLLQAFSNVPYNAGKLDVGSPIPKANVEVRFGSGKTQKAHRFLVPNGKSSGVSDNAYTYQDYVDVSFEVWDVTNNRQLMVSFRDQNRNGMFDLLPQNLDTTDAIHNSREYLYIQNSKYNPITPDPAIATTGGHKASMMYNIFPALASGATWTGNNTGTLGILYHTINKTNTTTVSASDPYGDYDGKNNSTVIHPDHHNLVAIPMDITAKTYQLLNANDGGVYVSNVATSPGTSQDSWSAAGSGYNTGQFYGADKRPGLEEYIGGLQDNGTQKSPVGASAAATSIYNRVFGGDGFEVVWNNNDDQKIIGGSNSNNFLRSLNGGTVWVSAINGFPLSNGSPDPNQFPFISKLATSKNNPDVLFTVGSQGVWKSNDFGGHWTATPIGSKWGLTSFLDVEVSRANANVIWAGAGMSPSLNLFVSTNNGNTFQATTNYTNPLGVITKLATHPIDPRTAYAIFSFAKAPKILRTTNMGQTWQDISGFGTGTTSTNGFPDVAVYSLYVRPDNPNIIWAGTEIGIVESLDNGQNWSLLTDFPSIAVWDMKGQDDEVVIATHGRGIWTAKISTDQTVLPNPLITAYGTSPQSQLVMQVHLPEIYDSTEIFINSKLSGLISTNSIGNYIIKVSNVASGSVTLQVIGFKNTAPANSAIIRAQQLSLKTYQTSYYNYFSNGSDFVSNGFSTGNLNGGDHPTLQTAHPYPANTNLTAVLRQPIMINNNHPFFFYRDVAMVEPGLANAVFGQPEFRDYVVVEATKDGLTWVTIADGYNASSTNTWLSSYKNNQSGTLSMEVDQNINLTKTLSIGDTVLFRFRLFSDNNGVTGWGWSVGDLYIQQVPLGLDPIVADFQAQVYPNPSQGQMFVKYSLPSSSIVRITLYEISGRIIRSYPLGIQDAGEYTLEITAGLQSGSYLVQVQTDLGRLIRKVIVSN